MMMVMIKNTGGESENSDNHDEYDGGDYDGDGHDEDNEGDNKDGRDLNHHFDEGDSEK